MGKFTAIKTYSRFLSLWNENKIDRNSLTFILDTGQLYTHGIFLNSVAYGTEANGAIDITIAGTSKSLSLSSHTHSNYLEKDKNIDIGTYKIVSGDKDLLYYNAGNTYLGNSASPVYLVGTEGKIVKGNSTYTLLDTGNFSIAGKTSSGVILSNTALFTYGDKTFQIDYIRRYNSTSNFDNLNGVTSAGTTTVNGYKYGFITLNEDGTTNPSWSLIRIDVANRKLEFRTSSNPSTWVSPSTSVPTNTATVAGIVSAPGENNSGKVWKTDASGTPAWRDETPNTWRNIRINDEKTDSLTTGTGTGALYIKEGSGIKVTWEGNKIVIKNDSLNVWNANAVGVAGYVAAPTKADNANMTWLTDADGNPAWRASNNHSHDYLPLSGGTMTGNITFSGDNNINWTRNTDSASISFANTGDGDTNSYMHFLTSDNGDEYFRFSHTSGGTNTEWMTIKSDGVRVKGTLVSLNGHKHAYTDLTGSGTTEDQVIVSTGTANEWTLKTLGSRAFDSTSYLPLSGGTMDNGAKILICSSSTDEYYGGALEIREHNRCLETQSAWAYAPAITFHWGNRTVGKLGLRSDGLIAYLDNPILTSINYSNYALPISGGTMNAGAIISWADWGLWGADSPTYPKANGGLLWTGTSDSLKLFAEETDSDDLRLILQCGDDDSPAFDIRKYDGTTTIRLHSNGTITGTSIINSSSSDSYVLLGGGGTKLISDFASSSYTMTFSIDANYLAAQLPKDMAIKAHNTYIEFWDGYEGAGWYNFLLGQLRAIDGVKVLSNNSWTDVSLVGHTHSYLPLSGGTVTGNISMNNSASITNLPINGGIYWNPYVESATDGTDAASITLISSGPEGGTTLVLTQQNDANDTIQFVTSGSANLYHNSNKIWDAGNDGSGSGLDADTVDGEHLSSWIYPTSPRNFVNGTLISTSIDYSRQEGDAFFMEISGDTYFEPGSMFTLVQGYIYANTIISYSVNNLGCIRITELYAMNIDGKLCFWFPRLGYWHSYRVGVYRSNAGNYWKNVAVSITDSAKPSGTKEVALHNTLYNNAFTNSNVASATKLQTARTIWGQLFDGSEDVDGNLRVLCQADGQRIAKFLNYSSAPYGLIIQSYADGSLLLQSQRESNDNDCFNLLLNSRGGNVGIGTTSPSYRLDVAGDIRATESLIVSSNNTTGGGIILADDGDIVDLNDAYCSMRFSYGVRIYSANRGGSPVITLKNDGLVYSSGFYHNSYGSPDYFLTSDGGAKYIDDVGIYTRTITVTGDANTYYPVKIPASGNKRKINTISVWRNLGETSYGYPENHEGYTNREGGCSCWYEFVGRSNWWDGNGGYYYTRRVWYGYARLLSHVSAPGGPVGELFVWLRGGGTTYNISTNYPISVPTIYYSRSNASESDTYPSYVEPRTDIGNQGILDKTYYGDITGSATKLQTTRTIWGQNFDGSGDVDGKLTINDNITNGGTTNSLLNILHNGTHEYGVAVKIHSYGGDSPAIRFSHSSSASEINSQVNANWCVGMYRSDYYKFAITQDRGTNGWGTARLVIDNSGNVGIGIDSPVYTLHVNGSTYLGKTTLDNTPFTDSVQILANNSNESDNDSIDATCASHGITFVRDWASGGSRCKEAGIYMVGSYNWKGGLVFRTKNNTDGNGTHDTNALLLVPDGRAFFVNNVYATNFYTTSDRSKKQNISSFSEHIRKFQLKDTEKWHYGVIAQEVPEMFRDGEEGNMTVNYNSVLSYYVGALENSVAGLEDAKRLLENRVKELENEILKLKNK